MKALCKGWTEISGVTPAGRYGQWPFAGPFSARINPAIANAVRVAGFTSAQADLRNYPDYSDWCEDVGISRRISGKLVASSRNALAVAASSIACTIC